MNLTKRIEAVEAALAKQSGETGIKVMLLQVGETEEQARERLGLTDWKGQALCVVFVDSTDANL
jgi:hypothetical protein